MNASRTDNIPIHCSFTELVEVAALVPNPRNPNKHSEKQISLLAKIIKNQGWRAPITVSNRSGFIVRGHGRLLAAQLLEAVLVPVDRQDYSSEAEEWADLIADNRIAELSDTDDELLGRLLSEIDADFDLELTGFTTKEIDKLLGELETKAVVEDDFDPAATAAMIKEPVTKPGDVWQLGRHRLMCGDATVLIDVERLMGEDLAAMVFTDPPYNVNYQGGTNDQLTIKNDHMPTEQFNRFLHDAFTSLFKITAPGGAIYVCHADSEGANFREALQSSGWALKQCLIWAKNQFVLGRQDYQWQHEPILYGWKPGAAHRWYGGRKQGTVIEDIYPVAVRPDGECYQITFTSGVETLTLRVPAYEVLQASNDSLSSIWRFEKPLRNGEHPTMKPINLCARAIQNSSRCGDIVVDFFGGSGSTLLAAEQTGRISRIMELDPVYCDVIVKRWEEFTGEKATIIN